MRFFLSPPFVFAPTARKPRHLYLESWEFISYLLSGVCLSLTEPYNINSYDMEWKVHSATQKGQQNFIRGNCRVYITMPRMDSTRNVTIHLKYISLLSRDLFNLIKISFRLFIISWGSEGMKIFHIFLLLYEKYLSACLSSFRVFSVWCVIAVERWNITFNFCYFCLLFSSRPPRCLSEAPLLKESYQKIWISEPHAAPVESNISCSSRLWVASMFRSSASW